MIRHARWALPLGWLLALSYAGTAFGHASLVESDPPDGGSIERTPATLTAQFDEELNPDPERSRIVVRDAADEVLARGGVDPDDETLMTVELPPLPPGEYRARWTAHTLDDDGTTRGTINFTIDQAPATATPLITPGPTSVPTTVGASVPPTAPQTVAPTAPTAAPTAGPGPSPTPSPAPAPDEPGTVDLLLALLGAGVVVAAIALYLFRRGPR